jgi:hypothetical protein
MFTRKFELTTLLAATVAATAVPAIAQQAGTDAVVVAAKAPGKGAVAAAVTASATVTAVDRDKRLVTLKDTQGQVVVVVAGPEVRNFDQIKVGDQVVVSHLEAVSLELKKGGDGIREKTESTNTDRAAPGAKPGAMAVHRVTVVADVVAVNARTQTLTLRGPERTVLLRVPDAKQFKAVKVGDQVTATFTEAVAIAVEPAPKK